MHVLSEPLPNAVVQVPCISGPAEMIMSGSMIKSGDLVTCIVRAERLRGAREGHVKHSFKGINSAIKPRFKYEPQTWHSSPPFARDNVEFQE